MGKQIAVIPKHIADWLEYCKKHDFTLFGCFDPVYNFEDVAGEDFEGDARKCIRWCRRESEIFAYAWLNGYRVKEDKKYLVTLKGVVNGSKALKHNVREDSWYMGIVQESLDLELFHTKEELVNAGFGGVFDNPLFEVKEIK